MTVPPTLPDDPRSVLALALDVDDAVAALRLARELRPFFRVAKVGLELYSAAGPDVISALNDLGFDVFIDLKLHDIPTTVGRAARVLGSIGAQYLTFHAQGGEAMLRAGVEGLVAGAEQAGLAVPTALAITILTSDSTAPQEALNQRLSAARDAGCRGFVCAASEVSAAKEMAPGLLAVVPGIRPEGSPTHDQARAATPRAALAAGADLLVIGRAVTASSDPAAAAEALTASIRT